MVNRSITALLDGLFPQYCSLCGLRSNRQYPLCQYCESELQTNTRSCRHCALPLPHLYDPASHGGPGLLCGNCLQKPPLFNRVIAPWLYCERLAFLIHRWKYHGEQRLTPLLASLWLQQVGELDPVDAIIPVPLHWRRLCQRGFNQSYLLCRQLRSSSKVIATAPLQHRLVRRQRATAAQSGIGASERTANLSGAFTVQQPCDNLRVAIVDDVLTTGATAASLAGALRRAGARQVDVWCLARTPAPGI